MAVRYAYGLTTALLVGGATISLLTGQPAGAQAAQNDNLLLNDAVPRADAPASFATLTEALQPAVVNISTRQQVEVRGGGNPFAGTPFADLFGDRGRGQQREPQTREAQSLGSGFFISSDGFVVTNNHVVSPQGRGTIEEVLVTLPDGSEYPAEVVGTDEASDLAVLKVTRGTPFPFVRFGDSDQARAGDWVIAIGNPFGLGGTVTSGIVSAVLRNTGSGAYDRYIQTDASINRGNSGGPLFDMQGNVIGINNAIFSPSGGSVGIGFAIPAEIAAPIVEQLRRGQEIERGYLGVGISPVADDLADALGLDDGSGEFVGNVQTDSPASRAGIQPGDVIVAVGGREVSEDESVSFLIANIAPGSRVPLTLYRQGERRRVEVTVGRRPSEQELRESNQVFDPDEDTEMPEGADSGVLPEALGIQAIELTPRIAGQLGIAEDTRGVVIAAVDRSSDAARKGLRRGDVILGVNYREIGSIEELEAAIGEARRRDRDAVLLQIRRRGQPAFYAPIRLR